MQSSKPIGSSNGETRRSLPLHAEPFQVYGMADRRKLIHRGRVLLDAMSGDLVSGDAHEVHEDVDGVWCNGQRIGVGAERVALPAFEGHPYAALLDALHREMLVNIVDHAPLPNVMVYRRPWYRDAAMVAMCFEKTGNLHLIEPWIASLRDPYDHNNGEDEPDNLGQVLYLASLVGDASHPIVAEVFEAAEACTRGGCLVGHTDGGPRPIYQTGWMKFGLARLRLDDPYTLPDTADTYADLAWWHDPQPCVPKQPTPDESCYPYLTWARAHFYRTPPPMHLLGPDRSAPLTWEAEASQADYGGMDPVGHAYREARVCLPHTWHAAEAFLYLYQLDSMS